MKFVIVFCLISFIAFGQEKPFPVDSFQLEGWFFHPEQNAPYERIKFLEKEDSLNKFEKSELDSLYNQYEGYGESVYDILGVGCSWYCGGGNYKIKSSSNTVGFEADSANDLNYYTAWVPQDSDTIPTITYFFKNKSPRINTIIFVSGFVRNDSLSRAYGRVKKFRVLANENIIGEYSISNNTGDISFTTDLLGRNEGGSDLELKFEILEVYPGEKVKSPAITEIYFDGIDVH